MRSRAYFLFTARDTRAAISSGQARCSGNELPTRARALRQRRFDRALVLFAHKTSPLLPYACGWAPKKKRYTQGRRISNEEAAKSLLKLTCLLRRGYTQLAGRLYEKQW